MPVAEHELVSGARAAADTSLFAFDREFGGIVCGVDEVGRGCLAGPLVACAVLLDCRAGSPAERRLTGLNDSKKLSAVQRAQLQAEVFVASAKVTVSFRPASTVDRDGLHVTNLQAMTDAVNRCAAGQEDVTVLVDGYPLPNLERAHFHVIKGDATSAAIAAASVVAKHVRDQFMIRAAERYPGYGFERHAGYGTAAHLQAIRELGVTPLHRMSFRCDAYPKTAGA